MNAHEFAAWLEFFRLQPFGPEADDLRLGQLSAICWNAWGGKPQRNAADFVLGGGRKQQSVGEMYHLLRGFTRARAAAQAKGSA